MVFYPQTNDVEDKAGYNQAGKIVEMLAMLRATYISSMMEGNLSSALKCIRRVLDVISGKVKEIEIEKFNEEISDIENELPEAEGTYISSNNGKTYLKNFKVRKEVESAIEDLYRLVEKTQDAYGYGMFSEEEGGL